MSKPQTVPPRFIVTDATRTTEMAFNDGKKWIAGLEKDDAIECVVIDSRPANNPAHYVAVGSRVFWILFWLLFFFPLAILMVFTCGHRTVDQWKPGRYLVTLRSGQKFIIDSAYDFALQFAERNERAKSAADFLNSGNAQHPQVTAIPAPAPQEAEEPNPWDRL